MQFLKTINIEKLFHASLGFVMCALIIAMVISSASAEPQRKLSDMRNCTDNMTLTSVQTYLNTDGNTSEITFNETCAFGCNTKLNDCRPAPIIEGVIGFSIIFMLLFFVFKLVSG